MQNWLVPINLSPLFCYDYYTLRQNSIFSPKIELPKNKIPIKISIFAPKFTFSSFSFFRENSSTHWGKIPLFIHICLGIWCLNNVNIVKNEILKMWILWKMWFWKCEFCQKYFFFLLTCHGSSANLALWPPMIRFANWRCRVIPHSGSLCRISLATRFWARPVPTKVSCNEDPISFFVAQHFSF